MRAIVVIQVFTVGVTMASVINYVQRGMKLTEKYGKPVCVLDNMPEECQPEIHSPATLARPGTVCSRSDIGGFFQCQEDGSWREIIERMKQSSDVKALQTSKRRRKKRFLGAIIGGIVGAVGCFFFCPRGGGGGGGGGGGSPNSFPELTCPSIGTQRPEVGTSMIVTWVEPVGKDKEDGDIKVKRTGLGPGIEFDEGTHIITYHVSDSQGFPASCQVIFSVKPTYCSQLPWPRYGTRYCTNRDITGSVCTFDCDKGYQIQESNSVTCEGGAWTGAIPKCQAKSCGTPPTVSNGALTCLGDTVYGTYCLMTCNRGYESQGLLMSMCTDAGQWTEPGTCTDFSPPVFTFGCPGDITDYAEKKDQPKQVTWTDPEVTDNSDASAVTLTSRPTKGSAFSVGSTTVTLLATDADGNSARCSFSVNIISQYCPAPDLGDDKLMYDCPDGHGYGYSCTLSCHSGYPLNGPSTIFCDKDNSGVLMWTWPDDSSKPFCRVTACPALDVPQNGALACDGWNNGPMCTMMCNEAYDVPRNVPDIYACGQQSGIWLPNTIVYGCTVKRRAEQMMLANEFYYYSGSCHDEATRRQIAESFIHILNTSTTFTDVCGTSVPECRPELVDVICGDTTRKKRQTIFKKQTVRIKITFSIFAMFEEQPGEDLQAARSRVENTLYSLRYAVDQLLSDGVLDQENYGVTAQADSYYPGVPDFYCPQGVPYYNTGSCRGCPLGTYTDGDDCIDCPVGTYSDEDFANSCKSCGEGMSTKSIRSKSAVNCTALCPRGSYSQDGMLPCTPCDPGSYQDDIGMMSCTACSATTTSQQGTDDVTDCVAFDFKIIANTETDLGELTSDLISLTLTYWFRVNTNSGNSMSVIKAPQGNSILSVSVTDTVSVDISGNVRDTTVSPASGRWQHLTLTLDGSTKGVKVYLNGNEEFTDTLPSLTNPVIPQGSTMTSVATSGEMMLSGISVLNRVISLTEVQTMAGTCLTSMQDSVFVFFRSGQKLVVPSVCDAEDDCASSPCGSHPCIDEIGGFTCDCQDVWTGHTCNIPPDYCAHHECQNSATCENGNTNYTCKCFKGFRGNLCEETIVNGKWSEWTQWAQCSQTCDNGSRTRRRECNSPPPDDDGEDCVGNTEENSSCNPDPCPACPPLTLSLGNVKSCWQVEGLERCNVTCRPDMVFLDTEFVPPVYECGAVTGYVWSHQEHDPKARPPPCARAVAAKSYTAIHSVRYSSLPCQVAAQAEPEVMSQVKKSTNDLSCVKDDVCSASSSLMTCDQSTTQKRSLTPAVIQITIIAQMASDLSTDIEVFAHNGTVTPNLQDYVNKVLNTDLTVQMLVNNSETYLQLTLGGATYSINPDTMTTVAIIGCPDGTVPAGGVCGECPIGTRAEDNKCVLCEKGTFQDVTASATCRPCPQGQTTLDIGSTQTSDCVDDGVERRHPNDPNHPDGESALPIILPPTIVGSLMLIVIIMFLAWKIKSTKSNQRPLSSGSTRKIQVHPTSDLPPPYTEKGQSRPLSPSSVTFSP